MSTKFNMGRSSNSRTSSVSGENGSANLPLPTTVHGSKVFMDAHDPVKVEERDRYPLGPPKFARE